MKSRTVQPIKRRTTNRKISQNTQPMPRVSSDTQPMPRISSDTKPMSRVRTDTRPTPRVRSNAQPKKRRKVTGTRAKVQSLSRARAKRSAVWGTAERVRQAQLTGGKRKTTYFDYDLLLVIIFLMCFGLVMLYSTSAYSAEADFQNDMFYFSKQALVGAVSFVGMLWVSTLDYHLYGAFAKEIFIVSIFLMALVKTPLGVEAYGARRWIQLPGNMTLQPAEITKIAVILFIAYILCERGRTAYSLKGAAQVGAYGAVAAGGVLFLTQNLSTAIIVMAITCILIFVVNPKTKPFMLALGAGAAFIAVIIMIVAVSMNNASSSENFRLRRIAVWLDPEKYADEGGYQVMQGLYAIGSGGFFGKGLGNSTQKLGIIPEVQNDMILTVICEELGVFGAIVILLLFGLLLYRLMFVAQNAPDLFGSLITVGIMAHIALQVVLNIAVVTRVIPTTGITLPFISYGGTSIVFLMAEMGIALGISRKIKIEEV